MPDFLKQLTSSQRAMAILGLVVALIPIWLLVRWGVSPTFVPLFQEVEWGEIGDITVELERAGIEYELENGGTEVQVRAVDLARARVLLAQEGHGVGRPGLELFDKSAWGMTDFTQRVTYRRALEGELARTIGRLKDVERAQVHLTLPEVSPLRRLDRPAEAAVVVTIMPGASLAPDAVRGIAALVSSSVEKLSTDHVAVLDDSGRLLAVPSGESTGMALTTRQLEMQSAVETQLVRKATDLLEDALGAGNAKIQVAALLDFEQVDRTIESYDPDGAVVSSEERAESDPQAGGAQGASTIFHNTYQNSRTIEHVVGSIGTIKRLTAAVLLNEAALQSQAGNDPNAVAARTATIESLVRTAVGFDEGRGDRVTVAAVPFEVGPAVDALVGEPAPTPSVWEVVERFIRPAVALMGLLLTFVLAWRVLRRQPLASEPGALAKAGEGDSLPAGDTSPQGVPQMLRREMLKGDSELPQVASQVVRAWLSEG